MARKGNNRARSSAAKASQAAGAFLDDDDDMLRECLTGLLDAGDDACIMSAVRGLSEEYGPEISSEFMDCVYDTAEYADLGEGGFARLFTVPVSIAAGSLPEFGRFVQGLDNCGLQGPDAAIHILPGWREAQVLAEMSPAGLRRLLLDIVDGREPSGLPPVAVLGDMEEDTAIFLAVVGVEIEPEASFKARLAAVAALPEGAGEEAYRRQLDAFDGWADGQTGKVGGIVAVLAPCRASEMAAMVLEYLREDAEFLEREEGGSQVVQMDMPPLFRELASFVEIAQAETDEPVHCTTAIVEGGSLQVSAVGQSGRVLDVIVLDADGLQADGAEMQRLRLFAESLGKAGAVPSGGGRPTGLEKLHGFVDIPAKEGRPALRVLQGGLSDVQEEDAEPLTRTLH